jgi:hypothetical protein
MSPEYRVEIFGRQFIVVDPQNEIVGRYASQEEASRPSKSARKKTKDGRRPGCW